MTIDVQTLIEKRPHLREPLELYARWQQFRDEAANLLKDLPVTTTPPGGTVYPREIVPAVFRAFVSAFDLPEDEFESLCQAVEEGGLEFSRLPLGEVPQIDELEGGDDEAATLMFLLSRPCFERLRESMNMGLNEWEQGRCPLCAAQATVATIVEGPKRHLHCSFCGTSGPYRFIGCPNCGSVDSDQFNTIMASDDPGFRVVTCDECKTYIKVVDSQVLSEMTLDLADMASLPLDIVAQERGFARTAPNPIGMKKLA